MAAGRNSTSHAWSAAHQINPPALEVLIMSKQSIILGNLSKTLSDSFLFTAGILLLLLLSTSTAYPAQVSLAWDESASPTLAGYKLYYGNSSRNYDAVIDVGRQNTYSLSNLEASKIYFLAVTAYDRYGIESDFSQELVCNIPTLDKDGDGLEDADETSIYGTDPTRADTDGDGISDGDELAFWRDSWNADSDGDGIINLLDPDSDNDGFADGIEIQSGHDPADGNYKPVSEKTAKASDSAALWQNATALETDWRWLNWFGYFNVQNAPWIYHMQHAWLYPYGTSTDSLVFWDPQMKAFWWTAEQTYPFLYRFSDNSWLWYQVGSSNPRWFYNYRTAQWESY